MSSVLFCKYCLVPHCGKMDNYDDIVAMHCDGGADDDNDSKEERDYTLTIGTGLSEEKSK